MSDRKNDDDRPGSGREMADEFRGRLTAADLRTLLATAEDGRKWVRIQVEDGGAEVYEVRDLAALLDLVDGPRTRALLELLCKDNEDEDEDYIGLTHESWTTVYEWLAAHGRGPNAPSKNERPGG